MVSSLAAQLARGTSLNASLLADRSKRKWAESYLFTGREADHHDLESIHALGLNGLTQLKSLQHTLGSFENLLFSDAAKNVDRTLITEEENVELDRTLALFLRQLGPYLMEAPTGKVLEWLVRRFAINEYNIQDVLTLFLPYHETPYFAKMISILHVKEQSLWSFLLPFKATAKSLPRTVLVTEMTKSTDVARFVTSLLPEFLAVKAVHRTLLGFNTSTLLEFITRSKSLDAGTLAFLLPALLEPLQEIKTPLRKDVILGSYVLLSALSQKCTFSSNALKVIVSTMISSGSQVDSGQMLTALISVMSAQDELDLVSDSDIDNIFELKDITKAIQGSLAWTGVDKVLHPLLPGLISRCFEPKIYTTVESILMMTDMPASAISRATLLIIRSLADDTIVAKTELTRLIPVVQQRHPSVFQTVMQEFAERHEGSQSTIDQLLLSTLSLPSSLKNEEDNEVLASTNADANVRAFAIRQILQILGANDDSISSSKLASLQEALKARLLDSDVAVIEVVYSNPGTLIPIISTSDFVTYLGKGLADQDASRSLLRLHLKFFCHDFCSANPTLKTQVFLNLVFGHVLFTKPKQKTAFTVWESLANSSLSQHELLNGTLEVVNPGNTESRTVESMSSINAAVASKIAENILSSNDYTTLLDWLIARMKDTDVHTRLLSYMVIRSLLGRLSGEQQVDAACRVLDSLDFGTSGDLGRVTDGIDNFGEAFDIEVAKSVVLKPSSRTTMQRLQIYVMALLPTILPPSKSTIDWLFHGTPNVFDTLNHRFIYLMRTVYRIANSSSSTPALSMIITRALFANLRHDSLLFLSGVWTQPSDQPDMESVRYVALKHAAAFLQAQPQDTPQDFQVVIPSLVISLQSDDRRVRAASMECITALTGLSTAPKPVAIYGYDVVYGAASETLQYLDWSDSGKYLGILNEHKDHLINDTEYTTALHHQFLSSKKSDSKKESKFKQRVLCFLLSHITSCPTVESKLTLLKTLEHVSDNVKIHMLLPVIEKAMENGTQEGFVPGHSDLLTLALASFDMTVAKDFNAPTSRLWPVFVKGLQYFYQPGQPRVQWMCLVTHLRDGLFNSLVHERQMEFCTVLLALGSSIEDPSLNIKGLLGSLIHKADLMADLLTLLQPITHDTSQRAGKRAKLDSSALDDAADDNLSSLTLLAEILASQKLPGSFDLISCLLETLSRVALASSDMHSDLSYIEQLLMSSIDSAASEIKETANLAPSAIKLNVLVDLMRVADNPQTFHQALLLMATLARLAPDSVLHNVMPIFTFMGSNVFHRDDSYSFRVIQKTVESIVPVMTSSLKQKYTDSLDLHIGSREFLRVFTEASTHVPRHRRTNFFTHLVDVLGPADFLAPVCMLLADKVANRVVRQSPDDSQASLILPLTLLQHYPAGVQAETIKEILREAQRLTAMLVEPGTVEKTFLEASSDDEHPVSPTLLRKRQSRTLVLLVGHSMKQIPHVPSDQEMPIALHDLVAALLEIATVEENEQTLADVREIGTTARWSLHKTLSVISAIDFINAVLSMLRTGPEKIQKDVLDLLAERLPAITVQTREVVSPTIIQIIERINALLSSVKNAQVISAAMGALRSIGSSANAKEEGPLTSLIPLILAAIRNYPDVAQVVTVLPTLIVKLGPRVIPHFRQLAETCVNILKERVTPNHQIFEESINVLNCLLNTIPSFWGSSEVKSIVCLYLELDPETLGVQPARLDSLMKILAKKLPSKTLLPTLCQIWPSIHVSASRDAVVQVGRYFELMKRSLHASSRADVLANLRVLFNLFIEAFGTRTKLDTHDAIPIEDKIISSYLELVVKLNEAAFKPLFRRSFDWAFGDAATRDRKMTFCRVYSSLLELFKGLMTPYMSLILNPFVELLESYSNRTVEDKELWSSSIDTFSKSFAFDEGVFWRDEKLRLVIEPVIKQIPVCVDFKLRKDQLTSCLIAMVDTMDDDSLLKSTNLQILMYTRSENSRIRLFALTCALALWQNHGRKLVGFVAETATFILECAEDENDDVVKESHKLKNAVEAEAGTIDGL